MDDRTVTEVAEDALGIVNPIEQEFRIVCAGYMTPGHHEHVYVKQGYDLCVKYMGKLDARTKGKAREVELPFSIQTRVVSEWEHALDE